MKTKPPTVRAALYARVSTDEQDVGLQLADLRALAQQRGWVITDEYVDQGVSGAQASRPQLDRMMADARRGLFNVVVVWKFDRFARSTQHLLSALETFRVLKIEFVSVRESVDTSTPIGKMVFTLLAAIAEFERDLIQERVRAGVRHAQATGKHCGRSKVEVDLRPALAMMREGRGLKQVANILGVPMTTLRRRLIEAGEWNKGGRAKPVKATADV